jgi:hypothetical protein
MAFSIQGEYSPCPMHAATPPVLRSSDALTRWLLDSDPSIRWQVMQDHMDVPANDIATERARIATVGFGAQLLSLQAPDGNLAGKAWNRGWTSTMHVLTLLKELGLDPDCPEARRAVALVCEHVTWSGCGPDECDRHRYFEGGDRGPASTAKSPPPARISVKDVRPLIERLIREQLSDGGWNCDAENGSKKSSFNTTICVLEALLEFELRQGPDPMVTKRRLNGEAYLLDRRLFRRRSTGATIEFDRKMGPTHATGQPAWTRFGFPDLVALRRAARAGVFPQGRRRAGRAHGRGD